jgi:cytochrome b
MAASEPVGRWSVWDWPVRLGHLALILGVALMWWTGETGKMELHSWVGYVILVVVSSRIIWGFVGSRYARFTQFVRGPSTILAYLRGRLPESPGHNPLGALSVLVLLALLFVQGATGLFTTDDIMFDGPLVGLAGDLSGTLGAIHETNWTLLQVFIALHVAAVLFYSLVKRQPIIRAMIVGKREESKGSDVPPVNTLWWVLLLALCAGLLTLILWFAPAPVSDYYF